MSGLLPQPVLVVGGGIAGLTLSIALRQAGQDVEIVELNPAWSVYGVGIIMQANALRALQRIGLSQACIAVGFPYHTSVHHEEDGTLRSARQKPSLDQEGLPASCGILRPSLHALLRDTALAAQAAEQMEAHRITSLLVVDEQARLCGALNSNDLMRAKVI